MKKLLLAGAAFDEVVAAAAMVKYSPKSKRHSRQTARQSTLNITLSPTQHSHPPISISKSQIFLNAASIAHAVSKHLVSRTRKSRRLKKRLVEPCSSTIASPWRKHIILSPPPKKLSRYERDGMYVFDTYLQHRNARH